MANRQPTALPLPRTPRPTVPPKSAAADEWTLTDHLTALIAAPYIPELHSDEDDVEPPKSAADRAAFEAASHVRKAPTNRTIQAVA